MRERETLEWLRERVIKAEKLAARGDLTGEFTPVLVGIEQKVLLDLELMKTGAQPSLGYAVCINQIDADLMLSVGKAEPDSLDWTARLDRCKRVIEQTLWAIGG